MNNLGAIEVSLTGKLSLQFAMAGTWRNPFKFKYLALANLNLGIGISVGAGGVLPTFGEYDDLLLSVTFIEARYPLSLCMNDWTIDIESLKMIISYRLRIQIMDPRYGSGKQLAQCVVL